MHKSSLKPTKTIKIPPIPFQPITAQLNPFSGCINIPTSIPTMLIANPTYLHADPDLKAILANQLALFCVSLPILNELPFVVSVIFILMMTVRILLLFFGVRKIAAWQMVLMLALVVALVMLQVGSFVGLQGGMALLLLLGALKSYEGHTRRDWQVAALVQIFLLTGAVLFNQSGRMGAGLLGADCRRARHFARTGYKNRRQAKPNRLRAYSIADDFAVYHHAAQRIAAVGHSAKPQQPIHHRHFRKHETGQHRQLGAKQRTRLHRHIQR